MWHATCDPVICTKRTTEGYCVKLRWEFMDKIHYLIRLSVFSAVLTRNFENCFPIQPKTRTGFRPVYKLCKSGWGITRFHTNSWTFTLNNSAQYNLLPNRCQVGSCSFQATNMPIPIFYYFVITLQPVIRKFETAVSLAGGYKPGIKDSGLLRHKLHL